jgi:acetone carboxylase gamma subunit
VTYKQRCALRITDVNDFVTLPCPSPDGFDAGFREYLCPGCGRLLQVDLHCPSTGAPELWADTIVTCC